MRKVWRMRSGTRLVGWLALAALAAAWGGCDCGSDGGPEYPDTGGGTRDTGPRRDAMLDDASRRDTPPSDPCEFVECPPLERCVGGSCEPYPSCPPDGMCPPGEVCVARRCVPGDTDIDGDGVAASMDCDETDPMVSPMEPERCNGIDDDCDMMIDEGDPAALCVGDPSGGECVDGGCGCPMGRFNLDGMPGCECEASPTLMQGTSCVEPIDLGELRDGAAAMMVQNGNVLPDDREVWYRFRAVDDPDDGGACDAFHARVQFTTNPDDAYELTVFRGGCTEAQCADMGFTDWQLRTDFMMDGLGECPCAMTPGAGQNQCADQSADFFVRVRRRAGRPVACAGYSLEFSNGVY